jgi:hypothetical protein
MDAVDSKQQHLDDRADGPVFELVDTPKAAKPGMTSKEAAAFLRGLRPVARVKQTLGSMVKKAKTSG